MIVRVKKVVTGESISEPALFNHSANNLRADSPCIGYCSTTIGDTQCRGCGRTLEEVVGWIGFTPEQKAAVWERVETEATAIRFRKKVAALKL